MISQQNELKYWLDGRLMIDVLGFLQHFMRHDYHMDEARPYKILSLYFDDLAHWARRDDGGRPRKLRLRFYNDDFNHLFFEIKHKKGLLVTKLRRPYNCDGDVQALLRNLTDGRLDAAAPEFCYYVRRLGLRPAFWTSYRRTALVGRSDPRLRVTFDEGLRGRSAIGSPSEHSRLHPCQLSSWSRRTIMEVKFGSFFPSWLDNLMRKLCLRPESVSKYGMVLQRCFRYAKEPA